MTHMGLSVFGNFDYVCPEFLDHFVPQSTNAWAHHDSDLYRTMRSEPLAHSHVILPDPFCSFTVWVVRAGCSINQR